MLAEPYLYSLGTYSGQPASMCSVCVRVFFRLQGRGVNHPGAAFNQELTEAPLPFGWDKFER